MHRLTHSLFCSCMGLENRARGSTDSAAESHLNKSGLLQSLSRNSISAGEPALLNAEEIVKEQDDGLRRKLQAAA